MDVTARYGISPGPWHISPRDHIVEASGGLITVDTRNSAADARAIAAVPALLAVAERAAAAGDVEALTILGRIRDERGATL